MGSITRRSGRHQLAYICHCEACPDQKRSDKTKQSESMYIDWCLSQTEKKEVPMEGEKKKKEKQREVTADQGLALIAWMDRRDRDNPANPGLGTYLPTLASFLKKPAP